VVGQFADEMLRDSDQVFKSRLLKLQKNTATLVELLDAHHGKRQRSRTDDAQNQNGDCEDCS
jgi:hypothetical protein